MRVKGVRPATTFPSVEPGGEIPPLIHQTSSNKDLPERLRRNVDELIASNPDWTHRFYDAQARESFIVEHYGADMLSAYLKIKPEYGAARADLFRYLVIYRLGGVYIDIKSRFTCPLSRIIRGDEKYILSQWRNGKGEPHEDFGLHPELSHFPGGELQNFHVIAAPGHPFLKAVITDVLRNIETYRPWRNGVGRIGVLRMTGPIAYTLAIAPLIESYPCTLLKNETQLALEFSIGEGYLHRSSFPTHYSQLHTSIVSLPASAAVLSKAYELAKRIKVWKVAPEDR